MPMGHIAHLRNIPQQKTKPQNSGEEDEILKSLQLDRWTTNDQKQFLTKECKMY